VAKKEDKSCEDCTTICLIKYILDMPIKQQDYLLSKLKSYDQFIKELGRRENPRQLFDEEVILHFAGRMLKGIAENISSNGMRIKSDILPNIGDVIKLTFPLNEGEEILHAEVVRVEPDRFSVQFKDSIDSSYFI
jgi:hypothetical protein